MKELVYFLVRVCMASRALSNISDHRGAPVGGATSRLTPPAGPV